VTQVIECLPRKCEAWVQIQIHPKNAKIRFVLRETVFGGESQECF
jgi:hypothetical protein